MLAIPLIIGLLFLDILTFDATHPVGLDHQPIIGFGTQSVCEGLEGKWDHTKSAAESCAISKIPFTSDEK